MLPILEQYFSKVNQVVGVEVIQHQGNWLFNIVELKKVKNNIDIVNKMTLVDDFDKLITFLSKEMPLFLVLNIQGIIHREVTNISTTIENKIQDVLPNANLEDFYHQIYPTYQGEIISIARKDKIDEVINEFQSRGFEPLHLTLGSFHVQTILPLLRDKDIIYTSLHTLVFSNDELSDFKTNQEFPDEDSVLVGQNWLDTILTVPFAAAFSGILSVANHATLVPSISANQEEFLWKRLFKVSLIIVLTIFLVGLSVNFLLFTQYTKENENLSIQAALKENQLQLLDTLQKKVTEQQGLVNLLDSKTSFYSDRIAASLPSDIELFEMILFPEQKQTVFDENAVTTYESKIIIIKGNSKNSFVYNQWLKSLKSLEWINTVKNINYQDINDDYSEFELKIMLN